MPHPHCSIARFTGILGALSVVFVLGCQAPTTHPIPPSRFAASRPVSSVTQPAASVTQPAASVTQPTSAPTQTDAPLLSPPPEKPAKSSKQRCQQVVQKYTRCMQAAYRLALSQQSRLPPNEAARSKPLLAQLHVALHDPKRETRLLDVCFRTPPPTKWLRCILQSPCDQLNRCRKTHIPQNY